MPGCDSPILIWQTVGVVPEVTGLSQTIAEDKIKSAGLVSAVRTVHSNEVPAGDVIRQEPASGCNSAIMTIFISDGFPYESGNGTANDPYQVFTAEQLNAIGLYANDWDRNFILMNDVDMSAFSGTSFNVIGTEYFPFKGVFDGDGHVVRNLTINTDGESIDYLGLFGHAMGPVHYYPGRPDSVIKNLGLANVDIDGGDDSNYVGGILGRAEAVDMTNCYVIGSASGGYGVGVLAGVVSESNMANCYAIGNVSGDRSVGGLIGYSNNITTNCYAAVRVGGDGGGGLVGYSYHDSDYINCFWDNEINVDITVLGNGNYSPPSVFGQSTLEMQSQSTFTAKGWDFVNDWQMPCPGVYPALSWQGVWVVPDVTGLSEVDAKELTGATGPDIFVITEHSQTVPAGHVMSQSPSAGCEAAMITLIVSDGMPYEAGNGTKDDPYQIWTAEQMNSIGLYFGDREKHFVLMSDINLSEYTGETFNITKRFNGVFNGNGHTISNFSYMTSSANYIALFGYLGTDGEIKNLRLTDINVDAKEANDVGGLVGYNLGKIVDCYLGGVVSGNHRVGGMVGNNSAGIIISCNVTGNVDGSQSTVGGLVGRNDGSITNSSASCTVNATYHVAGGLVGSNRGFIKKCYAICGTIQAGSQSCGGLVGSNNEGDIESCFAVGSVKGDDYVGGLIGSNSSGTAMNCYAACSVSGNNSVGGLTGRMFSGSHYICFWDSDVNPGLSGVGYGNSSGVMGRTTAQMQVQSTFADHGWDFIGEDVNGTDNIWWMPAGDYPKLVGVGTGPVVMAGLELVSKERVGRTEFEYTYRLEVENNHSENLTGVTITLQPVSDNMVVIDGDIFIGQINSGEVLVTDDTITLCVDRADGPADGRWVIEYGLSPAPTMQGVTFGLYADIIEDGVVNEKDLVRMMQSWLTSDAVADIAPVAEPDGTVNLLDFQILSLEWE